MSRRPTWPAPPRRTTQRQPPGSGLRGNGCWLPCAPPPWCASVGRLRPKDRGGVLLQTLEAYLATNGSPTDAAERLHLHRNTVLYRLGRIEDLLGVDLRDAEVRLGLHLALKIGDVLEG